MSGLMHFPGSPAGQLQEAGFPWNAMELRGLQGGATHTGHNVSGALLRLAKRKGRVANGRGELPLTLGIYLCQRNFPYCLL